MGALGTSAFCKSALCKFKVRSGVKVCRASASLTLLLVALCAGAQEKNAAPALLPTTVLRSAVEVSGGVVTLSDLLPDDAGARLRAAAGTIALGHAPQPGRQRVLERGQITRTLAARPALSRQLSVPASVTVRRAGWPISRSAVEKAVARFLPDGFVAAEDGKQKPGPAAAVQWNGEISGAEDAEIEATASHWDVQQKALAVRMRCVEPALCGSFLVLVRGVRPGPAETGGPRASAYLGSGHRSGHPSGQPSDYGGQSHRPWPSAEASRFPRPGRTLAEAGKPAKLLVEGDGFRISLPVICLQRGRMGQTIRAVDAAGHHVFWAQVIGAGRLQAIF
jgi:hypothetical protein